MMWQELVVGIIVLTAFIYVVYRFISKVTGKRAQGTTCSCDCSERCSHNKNCSLNV